MSHLFPSGTFLSFLKALLFLSYSCFCRLPLHIAKPPSTLSLHVVFKPTWLCEANNHAGVLGLAKYT